MTCVSNIKVDYSICYKKCEGLQVTSFDRKKASLDFISQISKQYDAYKEVYDFTKMRGNIFIDREKIII